MVQKRGTHFGVAFVVVGALVAAGGCRTKLNKQSCFNTACGVGFSCDVVTELCIAQDAGADSGVDGAGDDGGDARMDGAVDAGVLGIFLKTPTVSTIYTNKAITVEVGIAAGGPAPTRVDLVKGDGTVIGSATSAPYQITWDTTVEAEGSYDISAHAVASGQMAQTSSVTVWVDRTAPTMAESPVPGATNVALSDGISATFSEPLDPNTVPDGAVSLTSAGTTVPSTVTWNTDHTGVAIGVTDRSALSFPALVTVNLATTIADRAGNLLVGPTPWSWTVPQWVSLPSFPGQFATLAIGPDDQPVIAFLTPSTTAPTISIAKYKMGAAWDVSVPPPTASSVGGVVVAIDKTNAPTVAWGADHTYVARWSGSAWDTTFGHVPDDNNIVGSVTSLALDPASGAPFVGWGRPTCQMCGFASWVAEWTQTTWQPLFNATATVVTGAARLLIDSTGAPLLYSRGANAEVIEKYSAGSWLAIPTTGVRGGDVAVADTLAIDSQDRPVIVATEQATGTIFHLQYLNAGAWLDLINQPPGTPGLVNEVHLALTKTNQPALAWVEPNATSGSDDVHVAVYAKGAWDFSYGNLSGFAGQNTSARAVSIVLDSHGAPTVTWTEANGATGNVAVFMYRSNR